MSKNKLQRFADIARFPNVYELTDFQDKRDEKPKGKWAAEIFKNNNPLILELACGRGEYTLELARRNPRHNYVGIDIKGARIWKGAQCALKEELGNVRFLRIYIDHLEQYFAPGEVDQIWITFPDPYLKPSKKNKRLSSPKFLHIYKKVLKPGGIIHLKTDSDTLFSYTRQIIEQNNCEVIDLEEDIYRNRVDDELLTIKTYYEKKHMEQNKAIKYIRFKLPDTFEVVSSK